MTDLISDPREVARLSLTGGLALPDGIATEALEAAIEQMREVLLPMKIADLEKIKPQQIAITKVLGSIHLRIRPGDGEQTAKLWATVMLDSLSTLPARVALNAAVEAKSDPISFPGEVLGAILDRSTAHHARYSSACWKMERWLKELQTPKLEASDEAKNTPEELPDLDLGTMSEPLRKMGIGAGWLIEDDDSEDGVRWASQEEQEDHDARMQRVRGRARGKGKS